VEEAAFGLIEDLRREGIRYAEVIVSPQVHLRRGLSFPSLMAGLGRARRRASGAGWPALAFIADGGRLWGPAWFEEMVDQAVAFKPEGLVAIGLGGEESAAPARTFRRGFERARASGLGAVAHAGEGGDPGAVREVIDHLPVSRIGHGIAAAKDPRLLEELARRGTYLEICPTSNLMTRAVPDLRSHPLRKIVDAGVRVSLGSDDRTIFGTSLRAEISLALRELGLAPRMVPELVLNSIRGSYAASGLKRDLSARVREHGRRRGGSDGARISGS
jgi:aminodeoxyfutalosine deaminase